MTTATTARSRTLTRRLAAACVSVAALAASCSTGEAVQLDSIAPVAALTPFDSCDALLDHLRGEALERVGPYGLEVNDPFGPIAALEGDLAAPDSSGPSVREGGAAPAGDADPTVSGTNVQEAGIDEPDLVKADHERMVLVTDDQLVVVDLTGAAPRVAGRLDLPNGFDHELLVAGDRALVLTREDRGPYPTDDLVDGGIDRAVAVPSTTLTAVDLGDVDAPRATGTLRIESSYVSARMQGAVARVVVTSAAPDLGFVYPAESGEAGEARAQATNESVIEETTLDDWLPGWSIESEDEATSGRLDDCDAVHRPVEFAGFGLVSILTVDLEAGLGEPDPVSVLGAGDTVYASADNLYVATERLADEPVPEEGGTESTVEPTEPGSETGGRVEPDVGVEPDTGVEAPSEPVTDDEVIDLAPQTLDVRTSIHRFSAPAEGPVTYQASGEVEGRLLNQFSLSEHEDVLRVATSRGEPWLTESSDSLVTTLDTVGDRLVEVGRVEDLGRGEQIFAVRFVGPIGYVVTFRQTDPLYVIDLQDPSSPAVAGELKILGYSAYLHPIDETHVLGVGQDADESGSTSGTQVSLFDVSNPAAPVRTAQVTVPGGSSEVEWDHRAFLWWGPTGTAVLPVEGGGLTARPFEVGPYSTEALVLSVDAAAGTVLEQGRVEHRSSPVRRSVVIDDTLVTIDDTGLVFSTLSDLTRETDLTI